MNLSFQVENSRGAETLVVELHTLIVAGWAGRDADAIEHHIAELSALGVRRPSAVPLYYRIAENQLTQSPVVQVVGEATSGEAEVFVFAVGGELFVSVASDHTDRQLEVHSVALAKQVCVKPVGTHAWRFGDVSDHWDDLIIRSWVEESGSRVLYQEGALASLRRPLDLVGGYLGVADPASAVLPEGCGMSCGTVAVIGGIRPARGFALELFDPVRRRRLTHRYVVQPLPLVA